MSYSLQRNRPFAYYAETPRQAWNPRFDVRENKDTYELDGELPGVNQDDINMEFTDPKTLIVNGYVKRDYDAPEDLARGSDSGRGRGGGGGGGGARTSVSTEPTTRYWASERSVGRFQRIFTFPNDVDQDAVRASLKKGLLKVTIPKGAPATRRIRIE
ncbi:hypothetical protein KEM52_003565 [Ascosphaera acerosa]|nr:hypothetical protein KEM52_003565 [Ascosphaera acerosa]